MKVKNLIKESEEILRKPNLKWDEIKANPKPLKALYFRYLLFILICLPIASILGNFIFNPLFRKPIGTLLLNSLEKIAILFISIYLLSLVSIRITKLYKGISTKLNIHQLIVYSSTAYITASIAAALLENYHNLIIVCQLFGIYSIYLLNKGLPKMIEMPTDKKIPFVATIVLMAIIINICIITLANSLLHSNSI